MSTATGPQQTPTPEQGYQDTTGGGHARHVFGERWQGPSALGGDPRRKSPLMAIVLSMLPGLGQVYVGYYRQGITLVIIAGSLITVSSRSYNFGLHEFEPLLVMSAIFTWGYACVDAGRKAGLYNQALVGLRPMDLPENQRTPEWNGSIVGGVMMVLFGTLLFLHTMFGLPMEWVTNWWPLALVIVGIWLVLASIKSRKKEDEPAELTPPSDYPTP